MSASAMMAGPESSGAVVKCYRRRAANVQPGDWLPEYGAHVAVPALADPETGAWWLTLTDGRDLEFTPRGKLWLFREYAAPEWMAAAIADYRDARAAWELAREAVAIGYATEEREYAETHTAPRLAEFIRDAAAARREPERVAA